MQYFNIQNAKGCLQNFFASFKHDKVADKSYYIYFSILVFSQFIPNNSFKVYFFLLAAPFLLVKLINTKYSAKEYLFYSILGILILISAYYSKREGLLVAFVTLIGFKHLDFRKIVKIYLLIGSVVFMVSVLVGLFDLHNIKATDDQIRYIFNIEIYVRKLTLGYDHANLTFALYYSLVLAYMYLKFYTLKKFDYVMILLTGAIFFYLTFSRTGFFILIFSLIFLNVLKKSKSTKVLMLYKWIPTCIIVFSFALTYLHKAFPNGILDAVNKLLSDRLNLGHLFIDFFTPTFLGKYVDDISGSNLWYLKCDNSFILTLCTYGIIIFVGLCIITILIPKLKLEKEQIFLFIIFYIYGFTESLFINITFNFALFLFYPFLQLPQKKERSVLELLHVKKRAELTKRGTSNE